jgi:hypothetical protein
MVPDASQVEVYLEVGKQRTIAVVPAWPGWCRSGRDEAAALQALVAYGPRYALALKDTQLNFQAPATVQTLAVVERLPGDAVTDYGVPHRTLPEDDLPVGEAELGRMHTLLQACWSAFDDAVQAAGGKALRKGPRGGGRDLLKIAGHVRDAENSYLGSLGGKIKPGPADEPGPAQAAIRQAILTTLAASVQGEIPARGPRGGLRWTPRFFIRRLAWHDLDHAWEIQDRAAE